MCKITLPHKMKKENLVKVEKGAKTKGALRQAPRRTIN